MLKIGDFSRLTFVSVKTLRYYDDFGLLAPVRVDESTGYRYYAAEQLPRLNRILALKDLGLSLEEIKKLLDEELTAEQIRGMLQLKRFEAEEKVAEEQARITRVEARLAQIEKEGKMPMYDVALKKVPAQRVAAVRRSPADLRALGCTLRGAFWRLGPERRAAHGTDARHLSRSGVQGEGPRYRGGHPGGGQPAGGRRGADPGMPAAEMACTVYQGKYEEIGNAYSAVMAWIEPNGYRIAGPNREVYLRSPGDTGDPSQYVTEIQVPVEKA